MHLADGSTIVVIEDDLDTRTMLALWLSSLGCFVHTCADGKSGLETILMVRPDVAIIDIGLPDISGAEVARVVRATSDVGRIRLIALSGYEPDRHKHALRRAGFDHYMLKPVDIQAFRAMVLGESPPGSGPNGSGSRGSGEDEGG